MAQRKKTGMQIENVKVLLLNLSLLGGVVLQRGSKKAIKKAVLYLERKLKQKLSQQGSGQVYGAHQASAPGEPPTPETGELRASVTHNVTGGSIGTLPDPGGSITDARANVGTPLERGYHLEAGFHGRPYGNPRLPLVFVAARPWFYNTIGQEKGEVRTIIMVSLKDSLVKARLKKSKRRR